MRNKQPPIERQCLVCKTPFTSAACQVKRGGGKTCSLSCSAKLARMNGPQSPTVICETCKKPFKARSDLVKVGRARFCSHKCRGPSVSLRMSVERVERLVKICLVCKDSFIVPLWKRKRIMCSRACASQYASRHNKYANSSIELKIKKFLETSGIQFEAQKRIKRVAFPDFVVGNVCIFADGDYWHNYPNGTIKDLIQTIRLEKMGYKVLRFWERDINGDFNRVSREIMDGIKL